MSIEHNPPGSEYATHLIIPKMETLSHVTKSRYTLSFSSDGGGLLSAPSVFATALKLPTLKISKKYILLLVLLLYGLDTR